MHMTFRNPRTDETYSVTVLRHVARARNVTSPTPAGAAVGGSAPPSRPVSVLLCVASAHGEIGDEVLERGRGNLQLLREAAGNKDVMCSLLRAGAVSGAGGKMQVRLAELTCTILVCSCCVGGLGRARDDGRWARLRPQPLGRYSR